MTAAYSIVVGIAEGEYDEFLDDIYQAAKTRIAKRDEFRDYPPGTKVTLQNLMPQYLVGAEATVIRRKVKNYVIHLDADHGRFRAGRDLVVKPTMMTPA